MESGHVLSFLHRRRAAVGLVVLLVLTSGSASAQIVTLRFQPNRLFLAPGQSALVEIHSDGVPAAGLAAFQFDMLFDASSLSAADPNAGSGLDAFAPLGGNPLCSFVRGTPTCDDSPWFLTSTGRVPTGTTSIDNVVGEVLVAYGTSGAPAPPAGSGAIAIVELTASASTTSFLTLENIIVSDGGNPPMPYPVQGSAARVNLGTVPALGWARPFLILALCLSSWPALQLRRRKRAGSGTDRKGNSSTLA
jgi:hypothetical protein